MIALRAGDAITLNIELPPLSQFKQKGCLILKSRVGSDITLSNENVHEEIVVMEFSKSVLENLSVLC
jgi:hypothetical protein